MCFLKRWRCECSFRSNFSVHGREIRISDKYFPVFLKIPMSDFGLCYIKREKCFTFVVKIFKSIFQIYCMLFRVWNWSDMGSVYGKSISVFILNEMSEISLGFGCYFSSWSESEFIIFKRDRQHLSFALCILQLAVWLYLVIFTLNYEHSWSGPLFAYHQTYRENFWLDRF